MGYLRFALALIVMAAHLKPPSPFDAWANVAVLIFYAMSGYGCTAVMQNKYKGKPLLFLVTRWWRLWPTYLSVLLLSFLAWLIFPIEGWRFVAPSSLIAWTQQVLMLNQNPYFTLVSPAWMLPYLLGGYLAIALGISRTPQHSCVWLILSLGFAFQWALEDALGLPYARLTKASLSFAVGASCYWSRWAIPHDGRWAAMAGALSYPVFLSHYLVGAVVATAYGLPHGWPLFFAALGPTLALSWLLVVAVERPVQKFRSSLRNKSNVSL